MKKANLALLTINAAVTIAAMMPSTAMATACGTQGTKSVDLVCTITTGSTSYVATQVNFTGSRNVALNYTDSAQGFAACGYNNEGKSSFGLTTEGGSMQVISGTGATVITAIVTGSANGCN